MPINKIKFHSLAGSNIEIPKQNKLGGYYSIYAPEYLSLGSFEVKELDTRLGVEFEKGYFGVLKSVYNNEAGILLMLNSTIDESKCHLRIILMNAMFDPREVQNAHTAMFGNRQRITIKPGDEIARVYVVKYE